MIRFRFAFAAASALSLMRLLFGPTSHAEEKPIEPINGIDLSGWKTKGEASKSHWTLGKASLKPNDTAQIEVTPGGKELINSGGGGVDLFTERKFGDVHIELEVMVPKGSNSGIYLMGEYEIQVFDSYGKEHVEMKGVTPGGLTGKEAATGPLLFQGDHGAVAYRGIKITPSATKGK